MIGVPYHDFKETMPAKVRMEQERLYGLIRDHIRIAPRFGKSLGPLPLPEKGADLPAGIKTMYMCGEKTGTGPMSSVAGLFAESAGRLIDRLYRPEEVVVENGGDLYIRNSYEILSVIHAGGSPLSERLSLVIPPGRWGVCTSSGTMGHSFSKGKADAVTVAAESTPLADAWATALANMVQGPEDIERVLDEAGRIRELMCVVVIAGEKMGVRGGFEVKPLS